MSDTPGQFERMIALGERALAHIRSHRSAAHLWGLISYHGPIEVTVANTRRRPGVIVHRNHLTEADVTRHWDIPVTTVTRPIPAASMSTRVH